MKWRWVRLTQKDNWVPARVYEAKAGNDDSIVMIEGRSFWSRTVYRIGDIIEPPL